MHVPTLLLGFIIATLIGALFHVLRGGNLGRLLLYLLLSWIGFWLGHLAANSIGFTPGSLGILRLGPAALGAIVTLFFGHWLFAAGRHQESS
jgi:uncharacterized membrane protein YeaQ/YmgE (transglycosylase-associated protein family)